MAITNYLVHFKTKDTYDQTVVSNPLRNDAVAFIQDATIIRTHGTDYHCGSGPVALKSELATVATTGSYNDLIDLPEDSENVYLLDLTVLGNLETSSIEKNIGTDAYTNLDNAINNKQLICILVLSENQNIIIPVKAYKNDSNTIVLIFETGYVTCNFGIFSNGNCVFQASENSISANKVTGLADVATSGSYNDLSNKPEIPDVSELATKSELSNYLPLTGGTLTGVLTLKGDSSSGNVIELDNDNAQSFNIVSNNGKSVNIKANATSLSVTSEGVVISGIISDLITLDGTTKNQRIYSTSSISIVSGFTELRLDNTSGNVTVGNSVILTEDNYSNYITLTDTKNTTGTANAPYKLFLVGAIRQSEDGVVTYSNNAVYTQSGQLYATQMNATNGFYETSDARLKNFKDDIKAIDVISEIPTKYFTWKKDENSNPKLHIGTSAQEIQKIYPDLVTENEEGELSVDYARLSVIALAAIKELKKEINELKFIKIGGGD